MRGMGADQHLDWQGIAASALDWWRDAGVDVVIDEAPHDWRASARAAPAADAVAADAPPAAAVPGTIAEFLAWRVGPQAPEHGWAVPLVTAEGDPAADLMVVVDCPDGDRLIDGAAGRLFDRMLAAIGRDRAGVHLASLVAARPLGGRIPPEAHAPLADLLHRHVALAAPKSLLLIGGAANRALLGMDTLRARGSLRTINLDCATVEAVASWPPAYLLEQPARKAEAWKDLQLLIGGFR